MTRSVSENSLYVEHALQHEFLAKLYQAIWKDENRSLLEVSTAEIDNRGYDVVLSLGSITRHVQLKSSVLGGSTDEVTVSLELSKKPSGCVVWYEYESDTLEVQHFFYFGGKPGERLPDIADFPVARHTRANSEGVRSERPNIRRIKLTQFVSVKSLDELVGLLFG
jgi:hypothetical protein